MQDRFPGTQAIVRIRNKEIKGAKTIRPPVTGSYPYGIIGAAIEYRLRYYFGVENGMCVIVPLCTGNRLRFSARLDDAAPQVRSERVSVR
jgi:hypothetical protein